MINIDDIKEALNKKRKKTLAKIERDCARSDLSSANSWSGYLDCLDYLLKEIDKIGEGAVVLSTEEYSDLKIASDSLENAYEVNERLKKDIERLYNNLAKFKKEVRKVTAKEIITLLSEPPYIDFLEKWVLEDLAKKYGVEI